MGSIPIDLAWRKPIINHKTRRGHTALYNKSIQEGYGNAIQNFARSVAIIQNHARQ
jgi:hypothetical protein